MSISRIRTALEAGDLATAERLAREAIESNAEDALAYAYLGSILAGRGEASDALAEELSRAMEAGVHVLLAHEMTGLGGQERRAGCSFDSFFTTTPNVRTSPRLLSPALVSLPRGHVPKKMEWVEKRFPKKAAE